MSTAPRATRVRDAATSASDRAPSNSLGFQRFEALASLLKRPLSVLIFCWRAERGVEIGARLFKVSQLFVLQATRGAGGRVLRIDRDCRRVVLDLALGIVLFVKGIPAIAIGDPFWANPFGFKSIARSKSD